MYKEMVTASILLSDVCLSSKQPSLLRVVIMMGRPYV